MTPDVWTLVLVALIYTLVSAVGEFGRKAVGRIPWGWTVIFLTPLMAVAIGWMVMVLWNMSAPDLFGLPTIGLVPAIALGWLAGLLFRGVGPHSVYDVDGESDR